MFAPLYCATCGQDTPHNVLGDCIYCLPEYAGLKHGPDERLCPECGARWISPDDAYCAKCEREVQASFEADMEAYEIEQRLRVACGLCTECGNSPGEAVEFVSIAGDKYTLFYCHSCLHEYISDDGDHGGTIDYIRPYVRS